MDINSSESLPELIRTTVVDGAVERIEDLADALGTSIGERRTTPAALCQLFRELLGMSRFRALDGSWYLLKVLEDNWTSLSPQQRDYLLASLVEHFPAFQDRTSCLIMIEVIGGLRIVGDGLMDAPALSRLCGLVRISSEVHRALACHALVRFARDCPVVDLAKDAGEELIRLQDDPSEFVRRELVQSRRKQ